MTPDVLRRKLQKKAKRNRWGICPVCDRRTRKSVSQAYADQEWRPVLIEQCKNNKCDFRRELGWTGVPG